jgi:hypothetical protein
MRLSGLVLAGMARCVLAHGDHGDRGGSQRPEVDENASWMVKHMAGMLYLV